MSRAFLILGVVLDILLALFLVLVFGWVMDSWHDPNGAWVGATVTMLWFIAFALSAGAPLLAYWLTRRQSSPGRVAIDLVAGPRAHRRDGRRLYDFATVEETARMSR